MGEENKIVIDGVSITYADRGGAAPILAVQNIDLKIKAGQFICLVGPSGCGKTTLLRAIAKLQPTTQGAIHILQADKNRPLTAMVFQGAAVFPWMTVLDNVGYGLRTRGVPYAQRLATAKQWVKRVKLNRFEEAYPHQLSGGMQQRVGLARAFAYDAEVLLMDEPFGALDAQTRLILQDTLLQLWQESASTVVFVTHSIDEALTLADRVVVMSPRPGQILADLMVNIPRPRNAVSLRSDPAYGALFGQIWEMLKDTPA
jgi:NitT/TauT family transport system ATP-binding protein